VNPEYPAKIMLSPRRAPNNHHYRLFVVLSMLAWTGSGAACRSAPPSPPAVSPEAWAVVDGREIKRDEVEKAFRRVRDSSQTISPEEEMTAKLGLLNDLIAQDLLLAKAAALKLEVPENELETAYGNAKKNIADAEFQQEVTRRGLTAADIREGLRRELLAEKVINQEVGAKVTVTDQEVSDFFNANRAQFNVPEEAYHVAQILVTPVRDARVTNRTGDDAATPQAATAKIQMLMERLKAGADFRDLALGYSEDPDSAPRGGDLGLVPMSQLRQAPPPLRDAVLNKEPGAVNVATMNGAYALVLVVAHEQAGQRDLSMPPVRDGITRTLRGRKEQLLRTAYLTAVRSDAQVTNYLARRLVESKGAMPATPLAAPGTK
jgi:peptidyl-prolyl cis-trans isomerase SurA